MVQTFLRVVQGLPALLALGLVLGCSVQAVEEVEPERVTSSEQEVSRECTDAQASTGNPPCCYGMDDCWVTYGEKLWKCNDQFFGPAVCFRQFSTFLQSPVSLNLVEYHGLQSASCLSVTVDPLDYDHLNSTYCHLSKSFSGIDVARTIKIKPSANQRVFLHSRMGSYLPGQPGSYNCRYTYQILNPLACIGTIP